MRLEALVGGKVHVLSDTLGVVEIHVWKKVSYESFGALEPAFQFFNIVRGWVTSSIRWLIIGTFCVKDWSALCIRELLVQFGSKAF